MHVRARGRGGRTAGAVFELADVGASRHGRVGDQSLRRPAVGPSCPSMTACMQVMASPSAFAAAARFGAERGLPVVSRFVEPDVRPSPARGAAGRGAGREIQTPRARTMAALQLRDRFRCAHGRRCGPGVHGTNAGSDEQTRAAMRRARGLRAADGPARSGIATTRALAQAAANSTSARPRLLVAAGGPPDPLGPPLRR